MSRSLPVRRSANNAAAISAAPAVFVVIGSRPAGADGCITILRGEHEGTLAGAIRHALTILDVLASRYVGLQVDVQVLDCRNVPHFVCTAGGDS
jgi:hypothetical protein